MQNPIIAAAAAVLALSLPAAAQQTITCSSRNGKTQFCPADTSNGVMLLQEHSNGVCQQGSTWRYTNRGIVVNSGCRADFQVGDSQGNNADGGFGTNNRQNRGNANAYPNDNTQNSDSDN